MESLPNILITGYGSTIAKKLAKQLNNYNLKFLSTRKNPSENVFFWDIKRNYIDSQAIENVDIIVHLSGCSIISKHWTPKRQEEIIESRAGAAKLILNELKATNQTIKAFVSSSAVGIYGAKSSDKVYNEDDAYGTDFLAYSCKEWEDSADMYQRFKVAERVVKLRTGIVLSAKGGALPPLLLAAKYCLSSIIGSGKQMIPWIHIEDMVSLYLRAITDESMQGAFNAVAPNPVSHSELIKTIAKVVKRPILFPNVPGFFIKLIMGKRAVLLTDGSSVSSKKIQAKGFKFKYEQLNDALKSIIALNGLVYEK